MSGLYHHLAYFGIAAWLKTYSYTTTLSFWDFVLGGLIMIAFALAVMSIKILGVARSNPVKALSV